MKLRIQITISEEANALLEKQPNKSQYIEDLILSGDTWVPEAPKEDYLTREEVLDLIKLHSKPSDTSMGMPGSPFVPQPPNPDTGYPCCTKQTPCKHWIFNGAECQWKNELTGNTREVL
jgi:hypothetical protein